ncbi:MAG TPA: DnaJ C-terminal domain-containing protein [Pusillimonas sp.]|uniref:DnaJ C-terminal domain-containing protein n=1 Tax=Pusillimonas sp. TaxID=3040095 RepID=UPI002C7BD114|nr:DnaJ C-terminal domain-containing protein [Pusillimonas sp.]HUH87719.1 DnaJ C-terminal domain-containing protein [Pusillimonas sp.]
MKYIDYYQVLGLGRDATQDDIKKAYRKLAHQYHPDVSSESDAEHKFKQVAEAYATLKDPEKKAAYDSLGSHPQGQDFVPPNQWQQHFHEQSTDFSDVDLSDLLAAFAAAQRAQHQERARRPYNGQDFEATLPVTLEQVYAGAEAELTISLPEYDAQGMPRRSPKTYRIRVPKGASDGQRLRLPQKGGAGFNGGRAGDLYVTMQLQPHKLYRVSGRDLYLDLPLAPWEAALGAKVQVPTLGGTVEMNIPEGTVAGRKLRLTGRGLPDSSGRQGDLYAIVQIDVPVKLSERERELLRQWATESRFNPRSFPGAAT